MSEGQELALMPVSAQQPSLLRHFIIPLVQGEPVSIGVPLNKGHLDEAVAAVVTGDRVISELEMVLERLATRLVAHPVRIQLTEEELRLAAVAYQVCWFFHWAPEQQRVWGSRLENIVAETEGLLSRVGLPKTVGQALGRHLILRHLPLVYRVDTTISFDFFWSPLEFIGADKVEWVKLPGRSRGRKEERSVWVWRQVYQKPIGRAFWQMMSLSPLTNLLHCDRMHPYFTFWGTATALSVPSLCRLVTNRYLEVGLGQMMPALAKGFYKMLNDPQQPLSHKRYIARFVYNLALTHCALTREEALDRLPSAPLFGVSGGAGVPDDRDEGGADTAKDSPVTFYALVEALHMLRGALGGAHLCADEALSQRLSRFLAAARLEPGHAESAARELARGLQYEHFAL